MNASFRSLRRAFAAGALATLTISAGGCFNVEQAAEQPQTGEPAGQGGAAATGEPTLDIAMGDEAGPLDLNVDATVGEVSAADFASAFNANDQVPGVPAERSLNQIPSAPSFPPQPVASEPLAPEAFAPDPSAFSPSGGEFSAPPAIAGEFAPSPALKGAEGSAAPAPGEGLSPPPSFGGEFSAPPSLAEFQPPPAEAETLNPLADPANEAAVEPMQDPAPSLADGAPAAPLDFSPSTAPNVAGEGLQPAFDQPSVVESASSPAPLVDSGTSVAEAEASDVIGAEIVGAPDLTAQAPAPALASEPAEPSPAPSIGELTPPVVAPQPQDVAEAPSLRDAIGAVPIEEDASPEAPELAESTEQVGSPFEEEDFAPRFGPGRHLAGTPSADVPKSILTPGPALDPEEAEAGAPGVLAQESPSPRADALAMQLVDPAAPPPAGLRPTARPNATLPAFDPTAGERLIPPPIGGADFTPSPPGDANAATDPGAAPSPLAEATGSAPRELPMPGPARDEAEDEPVPAPPATRTPSGVRDSQPLIESTTSEIAEASRDWTDASGSHTLKAAILEYDQGEVRLETPKGERYVVSLSSLSRYDQGYVKGLAEGTLGKPPVERTWTDQSGEFTLVGEFLEDAGDAVRIARENGKTFRIAKDELADYDRGYVDGLADAKVQ